MSENNFNDKIIAEFRANRGRVGPPFEGTPLLLLHTVGARTGADRVHPIMYLEDGENYVVFASKGGAETNPDWYHNLKANPAAQIEVGAETHDVTGREALGDERDALYARQAALYPVFGEYERATKRTIPVLILSPRAS